MNHFFNYENGIMSAVARIADSVTLGILWVICSLPIFTIGASSAAFYYAYNHCIRQKKDYAWKTFFACFKSNFRQATQLWLIVLGVILISLLDAYLLQFMGGSAFLITVIQALITLTLLACLIWSLYLFPYISRFENPNKRAMKNAALIALANMAQSLLLLILFALCVIGVVCLPLLNLFIPTLYMLCANRILEAVFRKYMSAEDLATQLQDDGCQSSD